MKRSNLFPMLGIAAGLLAIILAIVSFTSGGSTISGDTGTRTAYSYYGGDAYTGIQQAAADTARNVKALSEIVLSGFRSVGGGNSAGFILLVMGFGLIAFSGAKLSEYKAAALYEQAVLSALKERPVPAKAPEEAPKAAETPAAPTNRWRMDTAWPVADSGEVARRAETLVTEPVAEAPVETPVETPAAETAAEEAPAEEPSEEKPSEAETTEEEPCEEEKNPGEV